MNRKLRKLFYIMIVIFLLPYDVAAAAKNLKPTDAFYVNDFAKVISKADKKEMIQYGKLLEKETGAQIVVVTVDFVNGESLESFALKIFNKWGIGSKEKNNGVLLLLSIGDDDYWAMQGEGLEDTLTSSKISDILQRYLEPDFAEKDYSAGVLKTYGAIYQELGGKGLSSKEKIAADAVENVDTVIADDTTNTYVTDTSNILNSEARTYIDKNSTVWKEKSNAAFYVVTKETCEEGLTYKEDAIKTFESISAGSRDVLLVMYSQDDNYWMLPGNDSDSFLTNEVLKKLMDNTLEPEFAVRDYSKGAMDTADRIYKLYQSNYISSDEISEKEPNTRRKYTEEQKEKLKTIYTMLFILLVWFLVARSKKKKYLHTYGIPFNPYSPRYTKKYGSQGYWESPHFYRHFHGRRPMRREYPTGTGYSKPKSSFWSSGGGGGRSFDSSDEEDSSSGGGGYSSGGGAGRSSSSSYSSSSSEDSSSSSSYSSSGGAGRSSSSSSSYEPTSGGGGSSRGGGAGRNK